MIILDGKKLSQEIGLELKKEIEGYKTKPCLIIVQVGDDSASSLFIKRKIKYAEKIGAEVRLIKMGVKVSEDDLVNEIEKANHDAGVHGIIVQLPLPEHFNNARIFNSIDPKKDVDGMSAINLHLLMSGDPGAIVPATAFGIGRLLEENNIKIHGKKVTVIGRSVLVGKPIALVMLNKNATVTVCHRYTENLIEHTKEADIIIVAVGERALITDKHIKEGQVIVDVGINRLDENSITGDTEIADKNVLKAISPVPGGVGPMTVASLFVNLVRVFKEQN